MSNEEHESDEARQAPSAPRTDDAHPRWRVTLYTTWVAQVFAMVGFSFVMPFMPFYIRDLGVTDPKLVAIWAGLLGSGAGITMAFAGPIWGWVADRYGRKMMVQRAMFGGAIILTLMGFARNVHELFGLRVIQGAITGTVPASVALVSSVVPKARLGFSLGLMQTAVFSGSAIGPYLGGIVADHFGYRVPFGVTGALLLTGGILVLFGAKERFVRPTGEAEEQPLRVREVLAIPGLLPLLAVFLLIHHINSLVMPIFPLYVEDIMGEPGAAASETGLILAVTGITAAFSSIAVGRLSDQFGHKRMLIACTALSGLMCLPQAAAQSVGQLLMLRAVFGLGAGGMFPAMNAMVAGIVPRRSLGQAYGLTTTFSAIGWATGPALGGWVASQLGYRIPFVIVGVLLLALIAAQHYGIREREQE